MPGMKPIMWPAERKLTHLEREQLQTQQTAAVRELIELEGSKSVSAADFGARIKGAKQRLANISETLTKGTLTEEVPCVYRMNSPKGGRKQLVSEADGEVFQETAMTDADKQGSLPFSENRPS